MGENIQTKGSNAYYYAHNRPFSVPADAKVVEGPGIITGGPPRKIAERESKTPMNSSDTMRKSEYCDRIEKYMFLEEVKETCEVIVNVPGVETAELEVRENDFVLYVKLSGQDRRKKLEVGPLYSTVVPEKCKKRVNVSKGKVTVTLTKQVPVKWNSLKAWNAAQ